MIEFSISHCPICQNPTLKRDRKVFDYDKNVNILASCPSHLEFIEVCKEDEEDLPTYRAVQIMRSWNFFVQFTIGYHTGDLLSAYKNTSNNLEPDNFDDCEVMEQFDQPLNLQSAEDIENAIKASLILLQSLEQNKFFV